MNALAHHESKCRELAKELTAARSECAGVALGKTTSNLFRRRDQRGSRKLDVDGFNRVLNISGQRLLAEVEGMTTYEALVNETLKQGLLPTVTPQLKTITVGGAVSGLGIESSSFRYGLVHESVEELEVLLADGSIATCSRTENPDLFFGFPNSYGTLGYALRLKIRLMETRPFVRLTHTRFSDSDAYFGAMCDDNAADFMDGVVFGGDEMYLTRGKFVAEAPFCSDYTYMGVYYKSIRTRELDYLSTRDYVWRWDTDWFWCSKHFGVQHPVVRLLATKWLLNSKTYQRIMRLSQRVQRDSATSESVIQDVDIPVAHAGEFLDFLLSEIGITPVWICPFRSGASGAIYPLYALNPGGLYMNFGFWDMVPTIREEGYYNRRIEQKALELEGKKGLYSRAYYDARTFWTIYNKPCYDRLKSRYDPEHVFPDLYEKCVQRR